MNYLRFVFVRDEKHKVIRGAWYRKNTHNYVLSSSMPFTIPPRAAMKEFSIDDVASSVILDR